LLKNKNPAVINAAGFLFFPVCLLSRLSRYSPLMKQEYIICF
jgi:hypothetical protein